MQNNSNILLVEDNPGDVLLIKEMLRETEFKATSLIVAKTLGNAIAENIIGKNIKLILLDLSLPDSDGMASIHAIRKYFPESALVILTGMDNETIAVGALKEGAQNYLVKGEIDEKILDRAIRYAIERQEIMTKLKLSEEKFSKLFYASPVIIIITSVNDGAIINVNDECLKVLGYTKEEMIGKTSRELNLWFDSHNRENLVQWVERDGVVKNYESMFMTKSGDVRSGLLSVEQIEIPEGKVLVTFANDITHLKKTEEALKESEVQLRETFNELNTYLYKSAHDLRAPVANMKGVLNLLEKDREANFDIYLKITKECCSKMEEITQKLSTLVAVNFEVPDNALVSVEETFNEAFAEASQHPAYTETVIEKKNMGGLQIGSCRRLLKILFVELFINSINFKHPRKDLKIILSAERADDDLILRFSDNGIGIPASEISKAFDLFFHSDNSVNSTGLELNIAKKIVEKLGGKIKLESAYGKGTTVVILFPGQANSAA